MRTLKCQIHLQSVGASSVAKSRRDPVFAYGRKFLGSQAPDNLAQTKAWEELRIHRGMSYAKESEIIKVWIQGLSEKVWYIAVNVEVYTGVRRVRSKAKLIESQSLIS